MATFAGDFTDSVISVDDPNAVVNVLFAQDYVRSPGQNVVLGAAPVSGPLSASPLPGPQTKPPFSGAYVPHFIQDWYYRVHLVPGVISLGNVVSDQGRSFVLWNAFFENKTFSAFTQTGADGVAVTSDEGVSPPAELLPLQVLNYSLSALVIGPPTINAVFTWTIEGVDYGLTVTGRRVVAFPFPPNWSVPINETLQFRSTMVKAQDGSVQTAAPRRKPRRIFDYTVLLTNQEAQRADNLIFGWQHRLYAMPVWTEKSKLNAAVAGGALVLNLDTSYRSYTAGGLLALYRAPNDFEVREIESVVGSAVTLKTPVENSWAESTAVYPAFIAAMNPSISGTYQTDRVLELPVRFTCEPSSTPDNASGVSGPLYLGVELTLDRPDWANGLSATWNSDADMIDLGGPSFALSPRSGFPEITRAHSWTHVGFQNIAEFRGWINRRAGFAVPFYMPTGIDDFNLAVDVLSSDTALSVKQNGYEDVVNAHPARRDIIVLFRDGTYLAKRIISAEISVEGYTRLVFDTGIGRTFTRAEVRRISYLSLYRLASNEITLSWLARPTVRVNANLVNYRTP